MLSNSNRTGHQPGSHGRECGTTLTVDSPTVTGQPEFADEAEAAILGLGTTYEAIVDALIAHGVKGVPEDRTGCLLWRFLHDVVGLPVDDLVTGFMSHAQGHDPVWVPGRVTFSTMPTERGQWVPAPLALPPLADRVANDFDNRLLPAEVYA